VRDSVPIVQEAWWAPGPVWTGAEYLALPPGFDPLTVQPVASCYTDWATRPNTFKKNQRHADLKHLQLDNSYSFIIISPC
jgi:hypothetical protein